MKCPIKGFKDWCPWWSMVGLGSLGFIIGLIWALSEAGFLENISILPLALIVIGFTTIVSSIASKLE